MLLASNHIRTLASIVAAQISSATCYLLQNTYFDREVNKDRNSERVLDQRNTLMLQVSVVLNVETVVTVRVISERHCGETRPLTWRSVSVVNMSPL